MVATGAWKATYVYIYKKYMYIYKTYVYVYNTYMYIYKIEKKKAD